MHKPLPFEVDRFLRTLADRPDGARVFSGTKLDRVGKTITLREHGTYRISMIGQAPDDNHLKLVIS